MEFEKRNNIKIIGRLLDTNLKENRSKKDGSKYIAGTITVQSVIEGETKEYEINLLTSELTAKKEPSKLFISYSKLPELVGKKIQVDGLLEESRYWSEKGKQMSSIIRLKGKFIKGVSETTQDEGTFEFGGFVTSPLTEKKSSKTNEIYRYDISVAQSNYNDSMISVCTFHVRPTDREIIAGLQKLYKPGDTVIINGILDHSKTISTRQSEVGFGSGAVKTFVNKMHNYWILGGSNPVTGESAYPAGVVSTLISAYKSRDEEIKIKSESNSDDVEEKPTISQRQTSLI